MHDPSHSMYIFPITYLADLGILTSAALCMRGLFIRLIICALVFWVGFNGYNWYTAAETGEGRLRMQGEGGGSKVGDVGREVLL